MSHVQERKLWMDKEKHIPIIHRIPSHDTEDEVDSDLFSEMVRLDDSTMATFKCDLAQVLSPLHTCNSSRNAAAKWNTTLCQNMTLDPRPTICLLGPGMRPM